MMRLSPTSTAARPRRGFVAAMAIVLLALVSTLLLAMATLFTAEHRRTNRAVEEAQLRQLLHAGAIAALADAAEAADAADPIALPPVLLADGALVRVEASGAVATIQATFAGRSREQELLLEQTEDGRRVISAEQR